MCTSLSNVQQAVIDDATKTVPINGTPPGLTEKPAKSAPVGNVPVSRKTADPKMGNQQGTDGAKSASTSKKKGQAKKASKQPSPKKTKASPSPSTTESSRQTSQSPTQGKIGKEQESIGAGSSNTDVYSDAMGKLDKPAVNPGDVKKVFESSSGDNTSFESVSCATPQLTPTGTRNKPLAEIAEPTDRVDALGKSIQQTIIERFSDTSPAPELAEPPADTAHVSNMDGKVSPEVTQQIIVAEDTRQGTSVVNNETSSTGSVEPSQKDETKCKPEEKNQPHEDRIAPDKTEEAHTPINVSHEKLENGAEEKEKARQGSSVSPNTKQAAEQHAAVKETAGSTELPHNEPVEQNTDEKLSVSVQGPVQGVADVNKEDKSTCKPEIENDAQNQCARDDLDAPDVPQSSQPVENAPAEVPKQPEINVPPVEETSPDKADSDWEEVSGTEVEATPLFITEPDISPCLNADPPDKEMESNAGPPDITTSENKSDQSNASETPACHEDKDFPPETSVSVGATHPGEVKTENEDTDVCVPDEEKSDTQHFSGSASLDVTNETKEPVLCTSSQNETEIPDRSVNVSRKTKPEKQDCTTDDSSNTKPQKQDCSVSVSSTAKSEKQDFSISVSGEVKLEKQNSSISVSSTAKPGYQERSISVSSKANAEKQDFSNTESTDTRTVASTGPPTEDRAEKRDSSINSPLMDSLLQLIKQTMESDNVESIEQSAVNISSDGHSRENANNPATQNTVALGQFSEYDDIAKTLTPDDVAEFERLKLNAMATDASDPIGGTDDDTLTQEDMAEFDRLKREVMKDKDEFSFGRTDGFDLSSGETTEDSVIEKPVKTSPAPSTAQEQVDETTAIDSVPLEKSEQVVVSSDTRDSADDIAILSEESTESVFAEPSPTRQRSLTEEEIRREIRKFMIPEMQEALPKSGTLNRMLDDLHDITPTSEHYPGMEEGERTTSPEGDDGSGHISRTSITSSELDISEHRDDVSTDSMYADDEDDSSSEVLFCKTYTEPERGTEVLVSCTVVNSALKQETCSSDEFWADNSAAEDAYQQVEFAAKAVNQHFTHARSQMQDIQHHLQALKYQMQDMEQQVVRTNLPSGDEFAFGDPERRAITD